ncbi:MAG: type II secretion system protein [Sarcina sp.]
MKKVKKGMTLLEIVISLAIIGILLLPMMNSLLSAVKANIKSERIQEAKLIGQQIVENLKVKDDIKKESINFRDASIEILDLVEVDINDPSKSYYPIKVDNVNGYSVDGKIYTKDILKVNEDQSSKDYITEELGALVVVDKDNIYYTDMLKSGQNIESIVSTNTGFIKKSMGGIKDINIVFEEFENTVSKEKQYKILLDNILINDISKDATTLGIYVIEENDFKFNFNNKSNKSEKIYVFRDSKLSKDEGTLNGNISLEGNINLYSNIIFDSNDSHKGLYSVELDMKRRDERIEKIQMEFYIGE